MRNIAVIAGLGLAAMAMSAELPVCEEFAGEENISCVRSGDVAVITSMSATGRSMEFYKGGKKAYMELSSDGRVVASSGLRLLDVAKVPAEDVEKYVAELLDGLMEDIAWK